MALLLGTVLVLNFVFFESVARWGLGRLARRTGIQIGFQSASGNLFTGRFELKDVTIARPESATSTFDLRAGEVVMDLAVLRILPFSTRIEQVVLKGLKGDFNRLAQPERMNLRRQYRIEHLRIEDLDVAVLDRTGDEELRFRLALQELDCQPLRSQYAIFDLLFRANISGEIEGRPFSVRTARLGTRGRQTEWEARELPVAFVARFVGGPFKWLNAGTVDVRVQDRWEVNESAEIEMRWSFVLKNLGFATPTNAPAAGQIIAAAIQDYLRRNALNLEITFGLNLDEKRFEGMASAGAAGLWDAARDGFIREVAVRSGADPKEVERRIQSGVDRVRSFLDRRKAKP